MPRQCEVSCPERAVGQSEPTKYDDGTGNTRQWLCRRHLLMTQRRHRLRVNGGTEQYREWRDDIERELATT